MVHDDTKIPDAERDVLVCLSRLQEATVRDLRDQLAPVRKLEATSVLTLLKRLEARGLVDRRKADRGKAFVYFPTAACASAWSGMMKDLLDRVFGGDTMAFMASFFETRRPTSEEIDQLQDLLSQLKAEQRKSSSAPQRRRRRK